MYTKSENWKQDPKLLWSLIITQQVSRVMHALTEGDNEYWLDRFVRGVLGLDTCLTWWKTDDYSDNVKKIHQDLINLMAQVRHEQGDVSAMLSKDSTFLKFKMILDELMKLIGKAGLYPEKDAGASEIDGVYV